MAKPTVEEVDDVNQLQGLYVGEFTNRKRIEYVLNLWKTSQLTENQNINVTLIGCDNDSDHYQDAFKSQPHEQF